VLNFCSECKQKENPIRNEYGAYFCKRENVPKENARLKKSSSGRPSGRGKSEFDFSLQMKGGEKRFIEEDLERQEGRSTLVKIETVRRRGDEKFLTQI